MSITVATLADRIQVALGDPAAATWPQASVESWLWEAIQDYSSYLPHIRPFTIAIASASWRFFDLPVPTVDILTVEYPQPRAGVAPALLIRGDHTNPNFWSDPKLWDWRPSRSRTTCPQLYISATPVVGTSIYCQIEGGQRPP